MKKGSCEKCKNGEQREEIIKKIINELETNPNPDGSISPNIQHWIEQKQIQLSKFKK